MIFDQPQDGDFESVFFAALPHRLKDGRTVWLEKVWKKEQVRFYIKLSSGRRIRFETLIADAPYSEYLRTQRCSVPPKGWWCSREPGHEGPCAALPE